MGGLALDLPVVGHGLPLEEAVDLGEVWPGRLVAAPALLQQVPHVALAAVGAGKGPLEQRKEEGAGNLNIPTNILFIAACLCH